MKFAALELTQIFRACWRKKKKPGITPGFGRL